MLQAAGAAYVRAVRARAGSAAGSLGYTTFIPLAAEGSFTHTGSSETWNKAHPLGLKWNKITPAAAKEMGCRPIHCAQGVQESFGEVFRQHSCDVASGGLWVWDLCE